MVQEGLQNEDTFRNIFRRGRISVRHRRYGFHFYLCSECTYPEAPCRFPDRSHGSIEGYGIMVSDLANQAGINYINGANTVTYFGALLCDAGGLQLLMPEAACPATETAGRE
ncbi:MAG TPA: hypothetical protein IAA63_09455 [Candidatus Pullilachnospira stercoravium]|uniref:Uncharacterized protein n=1 Tax=Candidatus Pullilachnospira stercoravium TaxID=2840913 RepID=A0A9D1T7C3_9FIRM|nr:hypothetical protein [Candidatus Pullilachnospira stercoravium]